MNSLASGLHFLAGLWLVPLCFGCSDEEGGGALSAADGTGSVPSAGAPSAASSSQDPGLGSLAPGSVCGTGITKAPSPVGSDPAAPPGSGNSVESSSVPSTNAPDNDSTTSGGAGGAPQQGGGQGAGGSPSDPSSSNTGGSATGGGGAGPASMCSLPPSSSQTTALYNGLRGQSFDKDWRFNRGDAQGAQDPNFDASAWRALNVPHDWSIELPFNSNSASGSGGGFLDGGVGWYRKSFTLDAAEAGKRILVEFDGVYANSEVWINGTSLGTRPYGYTSFEYDLTDHVAFDGSENLLAVRVDNDQPNSRWYSGSGIYRHVWLTTLRPVHIPNSGVFVTTPALNSDSASVSVNTEVVNQGSTSSQVAVSISISDACGAPVANADSAASELAAGASTTDTQTLTIATPTLWSIAAPYLYRVTVEVKVDGESVDSYSVPWGLRTTAFSAADGFSLNGEHMKLQGVCMHHDLGALGAAVNYRAIERQVEILKGMGVNAIRTAHNPPAPELLDVADRLGIMIMDEAFDTWTQTKTTHDYGTQFEEWAQRDIQAMVLRDRNHPSVVIWSIGNEVGGSTLSTAQNLKKWVLEIDPTRPVTWASNKMGGPHVSEGDDRAVAAALDLVGYNYAPYAGDYDADHAANPDWKIFGSETASAFASRGIYHTPADTITHSNDATSDKQCSSYDNEAARYGNTAREAYAYDQDRPYVLGSFVWTGFDYGGEPTPNSSWPSKSSYYGIIDTAGFPKDVYYFYQSRWTTAPMVHLLPHWNWTQGTMVVVQAYSNCESVELFLNDESLGAKPVAVDTFVAEWNVDWVAGTLSAECSNGGALAATDTMASASTATSVTLSADREPIRADGQDLIFVTAEIRDASGTLVPNADDLVAFAISGPGELVGLDNGDPTDTTSYKASSRKAFSGKALAIVRSTGGAGTITIEASADGLSSEPVAVEAR